VLLVSALCPRISAGASSRRNGLIKGTITPAGLVTRVCAVDRDVKTRLTPKTIPLKEYDGMLMNRGSAYEIRVPEGTYDLHFELRDGTKLEGADMRVQSGSDAKPLTEKDLSGIRARVDRIRSFENERHILEIAGAGTSARAIMKLVRTKPTSYDRKFGEPIAIFRWELWEFKKQTGSWLRDRTVRVLRRFLIAKRTMNEMTWEFSGRIGGIDVRADETSERNVDLTVGKDAPTSRSDEVRLEPPTPAGTSHHD
jgi:hypothetical protein